jgi:hypothetical protein
MNGPEASSGGGRRVVREIVVTYTLEGDSSGKEHTMGLRHSGQGAAVDGVVWSRRLMDRMAYQDQQASGRCVPVETRKGGPEWKKFGNPGPAGSDPTAGGGVESTGGDNEPMVARAAAGESDVAGECFWIHDESCIWTVICDI